MGLVVLLLRLLLVLVPPITRQYGYHHQYWLPATICKLLASLRTAEV